MKRILTIILCTICLCSCNYHSNSDESTKTNNQIEGVKNGLLITSDKLLNSEQKELKSKIYKILLENIEVDGTNNHLKLTLTEKEFKEKGIDESLYQKLLSEIDNLNSYADDSGKGKEMIENWIKSKEDYLKKQK